MIFFDDRKNKKCVQVTESSRFVWDFEVEEPYFGKDAYFMAKKFPVFANIYKVKVKLQANQHFLNVTANIMRDVGYLVPTL
jgi:hypothetical protein